MLSVTTGTVNLGLKLFNPRASIFSGVTLRKGRRMNAPNPKAAALQVSAGPRVFLKNSRKMSNKPSKTTAQPLLSSAKASPRSPQRSKAASNRSYTSSRMSR